MILAAVLLVHFKSHEATVGPQDPVISMITKGCPWLWHHWQIPRVGPDCHQDCKLAEMKGKGDVKALTKLVKECELNYHRTMTRLPSWRKI